MRAKNDEDYIHLRSDILLIVLFCVVCYQFFLGQKKFKRKVCSPMYDNYIGEYRQTSNIKRTLKCNKIVDHSDVVGASPVGAAPTTSSFST